jgi:hypothetical protein
VRTDPRIVFHLASAPDETLRRELTERQFDFLIVRGPIEDEQLEFESLFLLTHMSLWRVGAALGLNGAGLT